MDAPAFADAFGEWQGRGHGDAAGGIGPGHFVHLDIGRYGGAGQSIEGDGDRHVFGGGVAEIEGGGTVFAVEHVHFDARLFRVLRGAAEVVEEVPLAVLPQCQFG